MSLTSIQIELKGFVKVNNSTWRKGDIILRSWHITKGENVFERILNFEIGFKMWHKGLFVALITDEDSLDKILEELKCN